MWDSSVFADSNFVYMVAAIAIALIIVIICLVFYDSVPKHLKGIESQLDKLNKQLETQIHNKTTNESIKDIVREVMKEMKDET
jgi:uncharacterized protein YoxC